MTPSFNLLSFLIATFSFSFITVFPSDRGSEFKNQLIDDALEAFDIERSLSEKGNPYDNAVAEAMFKTIKTEFVNDANFPCQEALELALFDYVNWFRHTIIHGSLNHRTPAEYKC